MKKTFFVLAAACITAFTAQSCKTVQKPTTPEEAALVTYMTVPATIKSGEPVMLTFTVKNPSDKELKFLKWETPFEGFRNDFLDVHNPGGELVQYRGIMAKRVMPPPADAYITVAPGQSQTGSIDISTAYEVKLPGSYTIEYTAGDMSGLKKINKTVFKIVQ